MGYCVVYFGEAPNYNRAQLFEGRLVLTQG